MADFLDSAWDILQKGQAGDAKKSFELVFKGKAQLKSVHSMAHLDVNNIESVFAAFEMAEILGHLGEFSKEIGQLGSAIRQLIMKTIEKKIRYKRAKQNILPPAPYDKFLELLVRIPSRPPNSASVITFNYDLALDFAFHRQKVPWDYCLPEISAPEQSILFLKLHGSLNWARCENCSKVSFWNLSTEGDHPCWDAIDPHSMRADFSRASRECSSCCNKLAIDPVIIPPTWNKVHHCQELASVWQKAANELSEAENIFIIGYSWPLNDYFFHSLYSLGTISDYNTNFQRIWVFNPDKELYQHFSAMLAGVALTRYKFFAMPFGKAIECLDHVLIQERNVPEVFRGFEIRS